MIFITFKYRYRKQILIGVIVFILVLALTSSIVVYSLNKKEDKEPVKVVDDDPKVKKNVEKKSDEYKVDIKGEVMAPGIYTLKQNSRVIDVINLSGGLTEFADTSVINLSKKIKDEMVIIIYSKQEVRNFEKTKEKEKVLQEKCIQKDDNALKNDACITDSKTKGNTSIGGKISLSTATKEELMTLPGIGEAKANEIIKYRESNSFATIEDIKKVNGIGDSLFAKIKENITP